MFIALEKHWKPALKLSLCVEICRGGFACSCLVSMNIEIDFIYFFLYCLAGLLRTNGTTHIHATRPPLSYRTTSLYSTVSGSALELSCGKVATVEAITTNICMQRMDQRATSVWKGLLQDILQITMTLSDCRMKLKMFIHSWNNWCCFVLINTSPGCSYTAWTRNNLVFFELICFFVLTTSLSRFFRLTLVSFLQLHQAAVFSWKALIKASVR